MIKKNMFTASELISSALSHAPKHSKMSALEADVQNTALNN